MELVDTPGWTSRVFRPNAPSPLDDTLPPDSVHPWIPPAPPAPSPHKPPSPAADRHVADRPAAMQLPRATAATAHHEALRRYARLNRADQFRAADPTEKGFPRMHATARTVARTANRPNPTRKPPESHFRERNEGRRTPLPDRTPARRLSPDRHRRRQLRRLTRDFPWATIETTGP
jgi:hypothetical protein